MKTTAIGNTGLSVTSLSFGTSALGSMPDTYGYAVDEARARDTFNAIFDSPINLIDTSRNYGMGVSEQRLGAAIRAHGGLPEGNQISTKLDRNMETNRLGASEARRSIEESLEALGVDKVAILHLHDPEHCVSVQDITEPGGALDELFKMKDEGIADAVGLAMGNLDIMVPIVRERPFDVLISHNRYTLLNRSADALFTEAHARGIAIFNAAPYAGGVLAKGADHMKRITYQMADEAALSPVRAIEKVCADHGVSPGAMALQFSMRDPRIASTIVGVSTSARIAQSMEWATTPIPDAAWEALSTLPVSMEDPEANRDYKPG